MGGVDVRMVSLASVSALGVLSAALGLGCVADVGRSAESILGGETSTDDAVVAVVSRRVACDETPALACSGVVVAPRLVLTAAHCVQNFPGPTDLEIFFGADVTGPGTFVVVQAGAIDPDYDRVTGEHDLAMLLLAEQSAVAPLPLATEAVDTLPAGTVLRAVGYGTSSETTDEVGVRRSATMMLGEVRPGAFDASPGSGLSCRGDSGGPVLATLGGVERIVGITASGDSNCATRATQTRVDVARTSFVDPTLDALGALGPGWPSSAIPVAELSSHACAADADCPALMQCDGTDHRCALPALGAATFGASCTTDASCGGDTCARLWPTGPDACHCARSTVAPPPPMGSGGGCAVAPGRPAGAALWLGLAMLAAVAASRRPWLVLGALAAAGLAAVFLWPSPPPPTEAPDADGVVYEVLPPPTAVEAPDHAPPPSSGTPPTTRTMRELSGLTIAEQAELLGDTDFSDGIDLPPPDPHAEVEPAAPPAEYVPDEATVLQQREQGLHLLDVTLERLGHEAEQQEHDGDSEGAARTRVRIQRMQALRAQRETELQRLREGDELPTSVEPPRPERP